MIVNTGIKRAQLLHAFLRMQCAWNKKLAENLLHGNAVSTNKSATNALHKKISTQLSND